MIRAACVILAATLVGCAGPARYETEPTTKDRQTEAWAGRRAELEPRQSWVLDGRIAVQRGNEGAQARIN
ncbi:MAG: hypothetical protein ACREXT_10455, partial [Gammaproteobacteria bacterium]